MVAKFPDASRKQIQMRQVRLIGHCNAENNRHRLWRNRERARTAGCRVFRTRSVVIRAIEDGLSPG